MPKFRVQIARTIDEYATVEVEADSDVEAAAQVAATLEHDDEAYYTLVNNASWDIGDTRDERVLDAEPVKP